MISTTGRGVLGSLVPVICPPRFVVLADAITDHVVATLATSPSLLRRAFDAALIAYDLSALPRFRRRARTLTGAEAERHYRSWEHGLTPLQRRFATALNQMISLACFEQPAAMDAVGYRPGPWIEDVTRKRLAVYREDARRHAASILAPDPLRPGVRVASTRRRKVGD